MSRRVLSPTIDMVFKKFFTDNSDMLYPFISSLLDIPREKIKKIDILNPEMPPENITTKFCRLDLRLQVDDQLMNIEIQVKKENDYSERSMFYWAKLFTSELKSGDEYKRLKKAITINILNFRMFDSEKYHTEVVPMIKGTDTIFSDKMSINFFELPKLAHEINKDNLRDLWLQFIRADSEEEFEMLKNTNNPDIQKAVNSIYNMSDDERIYEAARMREKTLHDEASAIGNAKAEGRAEGKINTLIELVQDGLLSIKDASAKSNMPAYEFEKLLN